MQQTAKFDLEDPELRKKLILGIVGGLLTIFVGVINHAVGVDPVLNVLILLLIFIVLGCTIAYVRAEKREMEAMELAEKEAAFDEVRPYLEHVQKVLSDLDRQLEECQSHVKLQGSHVPHSIQNNLFVLERIRDGLDKRAEDLQGIIEEGGNDKIEEAKELGESPLTFHQDTVNAVITQAKLPDLPSDQWEHTLKSLLESVRAELS